MYGNWGPDWAWHLLGIFTILGMLSVAGGAGWLVWWLVSHLQWVG